MIFGTKLWLCYLLYYFSSSQEMRLKDNQDLMLSIVPFLTFTFWILVKPFRHLLMEFLSSVVIPCKLLETSKPSLEPDDSVTLIYRQACLQIPRTQLKPQCSGKYHILITPLFSQKSISLVMIFQNSCQFISTIITTRRNESKREWTHFAGKWERQTI